MPRLPSPDAGRGAGGWAGVAFLASGPGPVLHVWAACAPRATEASGGRGGGSGGGRGWLGAPYRRLRSVPWRGMGGPPRRAPPALLRRWARKRFPVAKGWPGFLLRPPSPPRVRGRRWVNRVGLDGGRCRQGLGPRNLSLEKQHLMNF